MDSQETPTTSVRFSFLAILGVKCGASDVKTSCLTTELQSRPLRLQTSLGGLEETSSEADRVEQRAGDSSSTAARGYKGRDQEQCKSGEYKRFWRAEAPGGSRP